MSLEDELLQSLENPHEISDPEARELMESIEDHYMESLETEDEDIASYEREIALRELERYEKVTSLEKESSQYNF